MATVLEPPSFLGIEAMMFSMVWRGGTVVFLISLAISAREARTGSGIRAISLRLQQSDPVEVLFEKRLAALRTSWALKVLLA